MKKLLKSILFLDVIFILIMFLISFILGLYNYQFLSWIKYLIIIICFIGIIIGTIQVLRKKKKLCFIICVLEFFIISILAFLLFLYYSCNVEEIVIKDDIKMIKETHSVLLSNWINYYDYENIFVRSKQVKIYEAHDDYIGEYLYTIYYDEDGNVIKREEEIR